MIFKSSNADLLYLTVEFILKLNNLRFQCNNKIPLYKGNAPLYYDNWSTYNSRLDRVPSQNVFGILRQSGSLMIS